MYEDGHITELQYKNTIKEPITPKITNFESGCLNQDTAFFCDYVRNVMLKDIRYGESEEARWNNFYKGGLRIHTTLDAELQATELETM